MSVPGIPLRMISTISAAADPGAYQALVPTSFVISAPPSAVRLQIASMRFGCSRKNSDRLGIVYMIPVIARVGVYARRQRVLVAEPREGVVVGHVVGHVVVPIHRRRARVLVSQQHVLRSKPCFFERALDQQQ